MIVNFTSQATPTSSAMERPQALPVMANAPPDGHFAAVGVDVVTPNWENPALYVLETRPNIGMDVVDRSSDDESMAGGSIAGVRCMVLLCNNLC